MFLRNLYATWFLTIWCIASGFHRVPAVISLPLSVLPLESLITKFISLCISIMCCAQNIYSMFLANQPSTFRSLCWKYFHSRSLTLLCSELYENLPKGKKSGNAKSSNSLSKSTYFGMLF